MTENIDSILRQISIAAHNYGRSRTTHLSDLRTSAEPDTPKRRKAKFSKFTLGKTAKAYRSRLYFRREGQYYGGPPFVKDYSRIVHSPSFRKLQGKSQLVPAGESEIFRTRLTHSIEVADIARRIGLWLNREKFERRYKINHDLVACACLLHDIGHPPFGHNGEAKLNELMKDHGGFESNAQTLRLITRLENRLGRGGEIQDVYDEPCGLNLTVGVLASVLKYDRLSEGPKIDGDKIEVAKGYYPEEAEIVEELRRRLEVPEGVRLSTIECQVMDIADDIAYSAYDLDDTMEAGIVEPFDFISVYDDSLEEITKYVNHQMRKHHAAGRTDYADSVTEKDVLRTLKAIFSTILTFADPQHPYDLENEDDRTVFVARSYNESILHARNHLVRRQFLETLIETNIRGIDVDFNSDQPFLSKLTIDGERLLAIECLKAYNFHRVIASRRLQVPLHGAREVLGFLFEALDKDTDGLLLSDVHRLQFRNLTHDPRKRKRLIADILASLTDLEAVQLFKRLRSGGSFFSYQ